jgi:hypothetical protein
MKILKYLLVVILSIPCWAEEPEDLSVSKFHHKLISEKDFNKNFGKDLFLKFYQKNKNEIWGQDGERKLWKSMVPFLKGYENELVINTVLKDKDLSEYSVEVLFGWSPFVMASKNSKIYYLLKD